MKVNFKSLIIIVVLIIVSTSCTKRIPKENRVYVKGEVVKMYYSSSGSVKMKFHDKSNKEHIEYYLHKIEKLKLGEKYWIAYNKENIEEINVFFTAPIIEDSTKYINKKACVTWCYQEDFDNSNDCRFEYTYYGTRYRRYQKLVDKNIKKGDLVDILVNKDRPSIAYVKGNCAITK